MKTITLELFPRGLCRLLHSQQYPLFTVSFYRRTNRISDDRNTETTKYGRRPNRNFQPFRRAGP